MNRKEAAELLPIIQAFSEGRVIEFSSITDVSKAWREVSDFPIGKDCALKRMNMFLRWDRLQVPSPLSSLQASFCSAVHDEPEKEVLALELPDEEKC